jgi:hypothetical protein
VTLAHEEIAFDVAFETEVAHGEPPTLVRSAPNLVADVPLSEVAEATVMQSLADFDAGLQASIADHAPPPPSA